MKKCLPAFLSATLISSLFLLACGQFMAVQAATSVSGIIGSSTTWTRTNSPYNLTDKVLIETGVTVTIETGVTVNFNNNFLRVNGTLIIQPGVTLNMNPQTSSAGDIDVNGVLTAIGTSNNPIHFIGGTKYIPGSPFAPPIHAYVSFASSSVPWNEHTGSGGTIQYAVFTETYLSTSASIKISNIQMNQAGIGVSGGSPVISNNVLSDGAITVSEGSATISNNLLNDASISLSAKCNSPKVTNNVIGNVYDEYGGQAEAISIAGEDYNTVGEILIEKNVLKNNYFGIYFSNSMSYAFSKTITIRYNTIADNEVGIYVDGDTSPTIKNNNIYDNSKGSVELTYFANEDINAANNWWGTTDTAAIDRSIHDFHDDFDLSTVNYLPILTSPDPNAPDADVPTATSSLEPTLSPKPAQFITPSPSVVPTFSPTPTETPLSFGLNVTEVAILALLVVIAVLLFVNFYYRRRGKPIQINSLPPPPPQ